MTYEEEKMQKKYREAESIRKERQRADARRLEDETRLAIRRAHNAEGRYDSILRNTKTLLLEFMERAVSYMVRKTLEQMVEDRRVLDALVMRFMEDVIIRTDPYGPSGIDIEIRNDGVEADPVITVAIPEFRMTRVLNDLTVTDLVGRVGPVVMPDRPIHLAQTASPSITYEDPQAAYVEVKNIVI